MNAIGGIGGIGGRMVVRVRARGGMYRLAFPTLGPTLGDLQAAIASHASLAVPAPLQVLSVECKESSDDCGIVGNDTAAAASGLSTQVCRRSLVPLEVDGTADPFATTLCGGLGMKHGDIVFLDVEGLEP